MHILLVEDDVELARQTVRWLHEVGHTSAHSTYDVSSLSLLTQQAFDAVIIDVDLPDMDGFAVVEQLRARGFGLPVLFFPARDNLTNRVRGLKVGGDDYVTKPFAWVINQSLFIIGSCDPSLQCHEASEHRYLSEVVEKHANRTAWLPW